MLNRDVEDDDDDGGVERSVKSFSRKLSYVSFAWRVSKNKIQDVAHLANFLFLFVFIDPTCYRAMERLIRFHLNREGKEC